MVTMVDTVMDMVLVTDMVDMDTDTMDTTARDPLMLRLSQDMATTDMDIVMVMVMDMAMVVMDMVMDMAMARDPPMLSQDMATTDTDTAMDMVTDTTDKQYKSFLLAV